MTEIWQEVEKIIQPIYQVGGSVRDEIMGRPPNDYDFATPLLPNEIEQKIRDAGRRPYLTGRKFGTIGVKINGELVEITTFRQEEYREGSRKPDVTFVDDITADLSRRDFTINAIAKRQHRYIDPFGGINDIKEKTIRSVGSANTRFKEDPLRMLRAARFAAQLGFHVDEKTQKFMYKKAYRILRVSKERWVAELDKILMSEVPSIGLNILMKNRLLDFILPEIAIQYKYDQENPYHQYDLWTHTYKVVDATPPVLVLRWGALLHDIGKPFVRVDKKNPDRGTYATHELLGADMVEKLGRHLRFSNERREALVELVKNHMTKNSPLRRYDTSATKLVDDKKEDFWKQYWNH